jgi:hypothetical protein
METADVISLQCQFLLFVSTYADVEPSSFESEDETTKISAPSTQLGQSSATVTAPSSDSIAPSTPADVTVETVYVARKRLTRPVYSPT